MTSWSSDQLGPLFWLFLLPSGRSGNAFGDKFRQQKHTPHRSNLDQKLQNKGKKKKKIKGHLSVSLVHAVRLRLWELVGYVCLSDVRFTSAFYRENLTFPWNLCYTEANPQWIGSFPADGSKTGFSSVHRSVVENWEWTLHANLPFFFSTGDLNNAKHFEISMLIRIR